LVKGKSYYAINGGRVRESKKVTKRKLIRKGLEKSFGTNQNQYGKCK
jgi:hypothetical protein